MTPTCRERARQVADWAPHVLEEVHDVQVATHGSTLHGSAVNGATCWGGRQQKDTVTFLAQRVLVLDGAAARQVGRQGGR